MKHNEESKNKIILPQNLQREMIKFFIHTLQAKNAKDKNSQHTPLNQKAEVDGNG